MVASRRLSGRLRLFRRASVISSSTSEGRSGEPRLYRGPPAISCTLYARFLPEAGASLPSTLPLCHPLPPPPGPQPYCLQLLLIRPLLLGSIGRAIFQVEIGSGSDFRSQNVQMPVAFPIRANDVIHILGTVRPRTGFPRRLLLGCRAAIPPYASRPHDGVQLGMPTGKPIQAAAGVPTR
jgi:hypothetical protein